MEVNWRGPVCSSKVEKTYDFMGILVKTGEGSWEILDVDDDDRLLVNQWAAGLFTMVGEYSEAWLKIRQFRERSYGSQSKIRPSPWIL